MRLLAGEETMQSHKRKAFHFSAKNPGNLGLDAQYVDKIVGGIEGFSLPERLR